MRWKINLKQSSNIFLAFQWTMFPLLLSPFSRTVQPEPWRTAGEMHKGLRHLVVLGSGCRLRDFRGWPLRTASLFSLRTVIQWDEQRRVHCAGCWDTIVRKGLTRSLSTGGSQSNGGGRWSVTIPIWDSGKAGETRQNDLAEKNWRSGEEWLRKLPECPGCSWGTDGSSKGPFLGLYFLIGHTKDAPKRNWE